jgi:hypothetical protein
MLVPADNVAGDGAEPGGGAPGAVTPQPVRWDFCQALGRRLGRRAADAPAVRHLERFGGDDMMALHVAGCWLC